MENTSGDPTANLSPPRDFYYYYGTLVYPLAEHESPWRIYANWEAMCATARWWVMTKVMDLETAFRGDPGTWMAARYSQLIELWGDAKRLDWPLRYRGRRLAMVIRQWVEEEPSATIAEELAHSDEWNHFLQYARSRRPDFHLPPDKWGPRQINVVGMHLEQAGLPSNPATARHFLALVNGASEPYPARGILVTTLCYMTPPYNAEMPEPQLVRFVHPSETIISGVTQWMPGTLLDRRVNNVIRRHQAFMQENEAAPYVPTSMGTSYRARQTVQGRAPSEMSIDYIASAVRYIRKEGIRPTDEYDPRFVQALHASYRATRGRIDRYNRKHPDEPPIPLTPPDNWRRTVLDLLRK